jgi:DNA polymerase-1
MKSFKDMNEPGNNLLLVDGLNMSFSFRGKTDFQDAYAKMILSLQRSYKCSKVIVCVDKGSSSFRKAAYPEYKYNRKQKQESQTPEEAAEFAAFFKCFEEALDTLQETTDIPIIRFQGVEADDSIAYICSKAKKLPFDHIWIVSSDRDLNLLISDKVSQFSYVTRKEFTVENWHTHYEWDLDSYISIKCLTGDTGDNVPGVPGIGPKKAQALVEEYGSTYDIISALPISSKYKHIANLNAFGAEALMLNYKLMDLVTFCEDALGEANVTKINELLKNYTNE